MLMMVILAPTILAAPALFDMSTRPPAPLVRVEFALRLEPVARRNPMSLFVLVGEKNAVRFRVRIIAAFGEI